MYRRGKYGIAIKVTPRKSGPGPLQFVMAAGLALVVVAFFSFRGCFRRREVPKPVPPPTSMVRPESDLRPPIVAPDSQGQQEQPSMPEIPPDEVEEVMSAIGGSDEVRSLADRGENRPPAVRALLERLEAADQQGNVGLQIDTIERLRQNKDSVADIDDLLARRLGNLNRKLFLEGKTNPWVVAYTVRNGDTVHQIAREHGATVAAVLMLNGVGDPRRLRPGQALRVPNKLKAKLKVHTASQIADLEINGKFFRRYDVSVGNGAELGERSVTRKEGEGAKQLIEKSRVRFSDPDLKEVAIMLPPGSSIVLLNP